MSRSHWTRAYFGDVQAKTEALQNMENAHIDKRSALMTLKQTKEELNLLMTESAGYEMEKYAFSLFPPNACTGSYVSTF